MNENEIKRFFRLFYRSLDSIDEGYFKTIYEGYFILRDKLENRGKFDGEDFLRYGERIFCYELYHQLRKRLEGSRDFLSGATLQGEVDKIKFAEFVNLLDVEELSKEFIPDFIIHSAGKRDYHHFVIEVKCSPDVSKENILADLMKIDEFIGKYGYERGIFLATNAKPKNVANRLNKIVGEVQKLTGLSQITIVCKESSLSPNLEWNWESNNWIEIK